jgi:hypothetical protein
MPRNLKTLAQMQAENNKLKSENTRLRTLFQISLDVAYQAVNGEEKEKNEEKKFSEKLTTCFGCNKLFNLARDTNPSYEPETGRFWCTNCVNKQKEEHE